jgi:hypothetical protein
MIKLQPYQLYRENSPLPWWLLPAKLKKEKEESSSDVS